MAEKPPPPPNRPAKPKRPVTPKRPASLAYGRWLGDFEPLSKVEKRLVEHCARGARLSLAKVPPDKPLAENRVRAGIIRFLLLGGDDENAAHEKGVMIEGAWIENALDLTQTHCRVRLAALACRFEQEITAIQAKIPELFLDGSSIPGLSADGIKVEGDLFLGAGFTAKGQVRIIGAEIGGDLLCGGGTFSNRDDTALHADRIKVKGSVFLRENFTATGGVRVVRAEIGGSLSCVRASFSNEGGFAFNGDGMNVKGNVFLREGFAAKGEVRMLGAEIVGDLDCSQGTFANEKNTALNLDGARVQNGLFLRNATVSGDVDLTTAFAGTLVDDQAWYKNATLILDGFRYDRIVGPTGAASRIGWLKRQRQSHLRGGFKPQPWEQLIRVLRDMGHPAEAAQIAMAKQKALREARQIGWREPKPGLSGWRRGLDKGWIGFSGFLARRLHWFYGVVAGYGHRPTRIVWSLLLICSFCSLAYYDGRDRGLIGPNAPVIQLHPRLTRCGTGGDPGKIHWTSPECPVPPEYSTFQPFFYSLDVIIPFVDLHQESDWGPVVTNRRGDTLWRGRLLRGIMWFEIIFGWILSVMFVAIVGRLVDKD